MLQNTILSAGEKTAVLQQRVQVYQLLYVKYIISQWWLWKKNENKIKNAVQMSVISGRAYIKYFTYSIIYECGDCVKNNNNNNAKCMHIYI